MRFTPNSSILQKTFIMYTPGVINNRECSVCVCDSDNGIRIASANGICPAGYTLCTTSSSQSCMPSTLYPVPTVGDNCKPFVYYYPVQGWTGPEGPVANTDIDGTGATEGCILRYSAEGKWVVDGKQSVQIGQFSYSEGQGVAIGLNAKAGLYGTSIGNSAGSSIHTYNVVLNATGIPLVPTSNNGFWIKPIRGEVDVSGFKALYYDEVSGEVVYSDP